MKRRFLLLIIAFVFMATPALAELRVVTTLPWIESVVRGIGKDKVRVRALVRASLDPHFIQPKPSMLLAVRRADILIYNGLELEAGYLPVLIEASRNKLVAFGRPGNIDASKFVEVIGKEADADRSKGDVHPGGNPHYHFSPKNILRAAVGLTNAFALADPTNASFFRGNLEQFSARLRAKSEQWRRLGLEGKSFVAFHKLFEYMAQDFGFEITAYVEPRPGVPPSSAYIQGLVRSMRERRPQAILTASYYGRREGAWLSKETGVKVAVVPHDVGAAIKGQEDWFGFMDRALRALTPMVR
jgi:zinc/manganese transport system substrate-binding protein